MSAHRIEGFETWVECYPSYYLVRDEPAKNYGVGNMTMTFYLKGEKGAVQWKISTDWGIKSVREHLDRFGWSKYDTPRQPKAWDIGYHAHAPHYEGQDKMGDDCQITGGVCYYDGSSLNAEPFVEGFLAGGTAWLWPKLVEVYRAWFEGGEWPDLTPSYRQHPDDIKAASIASAQHEGHGEAETGI